MDTFDCPNNSFLEIGTSWMSRAKIDTDGWQISLCINFLSWLVLFCANNWFLLFCIHICFFLFFAAGWLPFSSKKYSACSSTLILDVDPSIHAIEAKSIKLEFGLTNNDIFTEVVTVFDLQYNFILEILASNLHSQLLIPSWSRLLIIRSFGAVFFASDHYLHVWIHTQKLRRVSC